MKILYISQTSECDGSSLCLLGLLGVLKHKINFLVIVPKKGYLSKVLSESGHRYVIVPMWFCVYPECKKLSDLFLFFIRFVYRQVINIGSVLKIYKIARSYRPDIIHTNSGVIRAGYYVSWLLNIPHVWHLREFQDLDFGMNIFPFKGYMEFLINAKNNHVVVISKCIQDHFHHNHASLVRDGVRSVSFIPKDQPNSNGKYFLYVGSLTERKGFTDLIETWRRFSGLRSEECLLVAGQASKAYLKFVISYIKKNHLESRIVLLGLRADIDQLLANAEAVIVPSLNEAFGRVTAEAMFNRCIIIGRNSAGIAETLGTKELGFLFSSSEELLSLLLKVSCNSRNCFRKYIDNAENEARNYYTIEKNAYAVLEIYKKIAENGRSS